MSESELAALRAEIAALRRDVATVLASCQGIAATQAEHGRQIFALAEELAAIDAQLMADPPG